MSARNLGLNIQKLREDAKLSQAELAKHLPFTASRVSRIETGELGLTTEEAQQIAKAIGTNEAAEFAAYLGQEWRILENPGFDHPSRAALWEAEQALQRLSALKDDPDLRNAFLKHVESCGQALERAARFLYSVEHSIAFAGKPNVGKTTLICALAQLRDLTEKELARQMALQTGGGRTTTCEVHIREGGEYAVMVEPFSDEELRQHVSEFCDQLLSLGRAGSPDLPDGKEATPNSAEAERALRNMADLPTRRLKEADGSFRIEDKGVELAKAYPSKDELQIQVLSRMNLPLRRLASVSYPEGSPIPELKWLAKTFGEINFGRHPEFSLPRRIEISVPGSILQAESIRLRLVDTRGIDEPSAPRRDLQSFLDDERALLVLCSGFGDAPDAATLTFIERAIGAGAKRALLQRSALVVIPKGAEERTLLNDETGEPVGDTAEGRAVRRAQVQATAFTGLGVTGLPVEFFDALEPVDRETLCVFLLNQVRELRERAERQIESLAKTVDELIANRADLEVRAVFQLATRPIRSWLRANREIAAAREPVERDLLTGIRDLRYASSLRASVNRLGSWSKFDYWFALGAGTRREAASRAAKQIVEFGGLVKSALSDADLADAHGFLNHFSNTAEQAFAAYFIEVQQIGEAAFAEQLRQDHAYWSKCQGRWGLGPQYKEDIRAYTANWFADDARQSRHELIEREMQRRWQECIRKLEEQLQSSGGGEERSAEDHSNRPVAEAV